MTETSATTQECNGEAYCDKRKSDADEISHSDDQSASDLFDSFMEIANDPSLQDEHISDTKLDENLETGGAVTTLAQNSEITDLVAKDENEIQTDDGNDCERAVSSAAITQSDKEECNSGKGKPGNRCESNVGVRLSKAVDDLDGLQLRLSSMMASFGGQPSDNSIYVDESISESVGDKSEVANLENDEANDQETTADDNKQQQQLTTTTTTTTADHDEKPEVSSVEMETQKSPVESETPKAVDGMIDESEALPCSLEEQVSENDSMQNHCDKKESVDKQPEAGEEGNGAGDCGDGAQTDKQSGESISQKDIEVTEYQTSDAVELCSTDAADATCEITHCDEKIQVDSLSTNSPGVNASDVQTLAEVPDKDDSTNDLAPKLANGSIISSTCTVPEIEINTADQLSSNSERKSLDSLDMELSSHSSSQPGSPTQSDEGIDSDTRSDCGEDDATLDPESLQRSRPKSWYLEIASRDSIHSDSSVEGDTKPAGKFTKQGSLGEVLIRGHLLKMGGSGLKPKNWRKRWFVLKKDNCLYYYKQSKDKDSLGVIVLANYSLSKAVEVNKKFCFKLSKGGARTYYLCAADEGDMRKWMMALNNALRRAAEVDYNSFQISESNVHNVSIPALSIRDPDCHGYLSKLGQGKVKTWKRRYCVLKNGYLYYYTDMSNATALGVAQLLGYVLEKRDQQRKRFCFNALPPEGSLRTYFFAADSEGERQRWMSRLEASIRKGEGVTADDQTNH